MAYTKTIWQTGDIITAVKLNNLEDGVEDNSLLTIDLSEDTWESVGEDEYVLSKSMDWYRGVCEQFYSGKRIMIVTPALENVLPELNWVSYVDPMLKVPLFAPDNTNIDNQLVTSIGFGLESGAEFDVVISGGSNAV